MVNPSDDKSSLGFSPILADSPIPPSTEKVVEGAITQEDYLNLYRQMVSSGGVNTDSGVMRKYRMTSNVEDYPRTHPEYYPDSTEQSYNDSTEILNQQYTNLSLVLVTTAALGLIAIMITSGENAQ